MSLRNTVVVLGVLSFAVFGASVALAASYFTDLSALTGTGSDYYSAYPTAVSSSGAVAMQGLSAAQPSNYYHSYLYTGGSSPTMNDITTTFGGTATRVLSMNAGGQMSACLGAQNSGVSAIYSGGLGGTTTVLPVPPGCTAKIAAMAIDNAGEVGGVAALNNSNPQYTAAVYSGGSAYLVDQPPMTGATPPHPNSNWIGAMSPNGAYALGQWLYYYDPPDGPFAAYACVWTPKTAGSTTSWTNGGTWTDISMALGGGTAYTHSLALAANNSGQILCEVGGPYGLVGTGPVGSNAAIYQMGTGAVTQLGGGFKVGPVLGGETFNQDSQLQQSINASGQVAGSVVVGGVNHAAVWQNGTVTDLNILFASELPSGFVLNTATAINDTGYIGGFGTDGSGHVNQAFRLQLVPGDANFDGKVDINDLSKVLTDYDKTGMAWIDGDFNGDGKVDINDLSTVLTNYDRSLAASGMAASAVPEPSTIALLSVVLAAVLACAWRKRRSP